DCARSASLQRLKPAAVPLRAELTVRHTARPAPTEQQDDEQVPAHAAELEDLARGAGGADPRHSGKPHLLPAGGAAGRAAGAAGGGGVQGHQGQGRGTGQRTQSPGLPAGAGAGLAALRSGLLPLRQAPAWSHPAPRPLQIYSCLCCCSREWTGGSRGRGRGCGRQPPPP
ncbi:hypothetical protein B484DRAFT_420143, partial [Ochromonadaceae sp. CCMP2298]